MGDQFEPPARKLNCRSDTTQSSTMGDATQVDLPGAGQSSRPLGTGMRPCHALPQLCSHVCSHITVANSAQVRAREEKTEKYVSYFVCMCIVTVLDRHMPPTALPGAHMPPATAGPVVVMSGASCWARLILCSAAHRTTAGCGSSTSEAERSLRRIGGGATASESRGIEARLVAVDKAKAEEAVAREAAAMRAPSEAVVRARPGALSGVVQAGSSAAALPPSAADGSAGGSGGGDRGRGGGCVGRCAWALAAHSKMDPSASEPLVRRESSGGGGTARPCAAAGGSGVGAGTRGDDDGGSVGGASGSSRSRKGGGGGVAAPGAEAAAADSGRSGSIDAAGDGSGSTDAGAGEVGDDSSRPSSLAEEGSGCGSG